MQANAKAIAPGFPSAGCAPSIESAGHNATKCNPLFASTDDTDLRSLIASHLEVGERVLPGDLAFDGTHLWVANENSYGVPIL